MWSPRVVCLVLALSCLPIASTDYSHTHFRLVGQGRESQGHLEQEIHDPEESMNATQLITSKGFPCEVHHVTTDDGYILTLQRIAHGRGSQPKAAGARPVVLLQHGLLCSADDFLVNLVNESLAYILADAGADVWLGNSRGNRYSLGHRRLSHRHRQYWDFSWDEMAQFDLPAMVRYIVKETGVGQIDYVGHSQGTTIAFAGLSENKHLAAHIRRVIALSPIATVGDIRSPLKEIAPHFSKLMHLMTVVMGLHGQFAVFDEEKSQKLVQACETLGVDTCADFLLALVGEDAKSFNKTRIPVYAAHMPAGTSIRNMNHWAQAVLTKQFQKYDFGPIGNQRHYQQATPPHYLPTKVKVPVAVFRGGQDYLMGQDDIAWLMPQLNVTADVNIQRYNHMDFIYATDAPSLIYKYIINLVFGGEH